MDYAECLKVHGYIVDKSDRENSKVEEIYNKYKPTPVPYNEFKHRVVTIYADSTTPSESNNNSSSNTSLRARQTANPSATVQRNRPTSYSAAVVRPVSNINSVLQQQLDQFTNSYQQQQRTVTPIRDILGQSITVRGRGAPARARTRVPSPPRAPVVPSPPASRVYTLPPATNIPVHNTWTEPRAAMDSEPVRPPTPRNDIQVPYQPLVTQRPHCRRQQQQQEEEEAEEQNDCCCCIC